MRGVV